MLKGLFYPFTPDGSSSLMPELPWHYAGSTMVVTYRADPEKMKLLLPDGLEPLGACCAAYFFEWQTAADSGKGYLDPIRSQYREMFLLMSCQYQGSPASYCPFIWVDNDVALQRGLLQGYPKQLGSIGLTRAYPVPGKASPVYGPGGRFAGSCTAKDHRLIDGTVSLKERSEVLPYPFITNIVNRFALPDISSRGRGEKLLDLLVTKSNTRDIGLSEIWVGNAQLTIHTDYYPELGLLAPVEMGRGYTLSMCFTLDSVEYADPRGNHS